MTTPANTVLLTFLALAGAEARRPLGLAVVGGLLFSQMLTLFVTPVVYTYMDGLEGWARRPFSGAGGEESTARAVSGP